MQYQFQLPNSNLLSKVSENFTVLFLTLFEFSLCEDCITDEDCGFCYDKDSPASTGSCLRVYEDKPERYAATSNWTTFRCNKTSVWDTSRSDRTYYWADSYCPTDYSWMAVLGLALFVMGFAPGRKVSILKRRTSNKAKYIQFILSWK